MARSGGHCIQRRWLRKALEVDGTEELLGLKLTRTTFHGTLKKLQDRPDLIVKTFGLLMNRNFRLDQRDFTLGISACRRSKLWQDACWLLDVMPEANVVPNDFSYNATISACGDWSKPGSLFSHRNSGCLRGYTTCLVLCLSK